MRLHRLRALCDGFAANCARLQRDAHPAVYDEARGTSMVRRSTEGVRAARTRSSRLVTSREPGAFAPKLCSARAAAVRVARSRAHALVRHAAKPGFTRMARLLHKLEALPATALGGTSVQCAITATRTTASPRATTRADAVFVCSARSRHIPNRDTHDEHLARSLCSAQVPAISTCSRSSAAKALAAADVVLLDDLANPDIVSLAPRARVIRVGKRGGCKSTPQAFIQRLMQRYASKGLHVVRVKGGDALLFGRAGEEIAALRRAQIPVDIVNGISSGFAAAARLGVSLTHREHCQGVTFVTAHMQDHGEPDWAALAATGTTLAIYMGMSRIESICAGLADDAAREHARGGRAMGGHVERDSGSSRRSAVSPTMRRRPGSAVRR